MADAFSNAECADMHLMYGLAEGNSHEARRLYTERFPMRRAPNARYFATLYRNLREMGSFMVGRRREGAGPPANRRVQHQAAVLQRFQDNPGTSTRTVARQEGISKDLVHRIARDDGLYPYHKQKVQKLMPEDPGRRMTFAQWVLDRIEIQPDFPYLLLQTDEATFNETGMYNLHNIHDWAHQNPHGTMTRARQERFSVNLWVGLIGEHVIGPYILPARLTGLNYLIFLQDVLPELLEDLPLNIRNRMWFQHDGAPAHFLHAVRAHLYALFGENWMGRGGPVPWPARSPDVPRPDFCYWGWMNDLIYDGTEINSQEELIA